MLAGVLHQVRHLARSTSEVIRSCVMRWLRPAAEGSVVLGAAVDLVRGKPELVAENALLRQPLIILTRSVKRPRLTQADRARLVLLASRVRAWRRVLVIVQPATLLHWHRSGFRLFWRWRSAARSRQPRISPDVVALIDRLARENRLWGAERLRVLFGDIGTAPGSPTSWPATAAAPGSGRRALR